MLYLYVLSYAVCLSTLSVVPAGSTCQYDEGSPFVQDYVEPADDPSGVIPTAVGIFSKDPRCDPISKSVYIIECRSTIFGL